jgi:hypothetical protein
MERGDLTQGHDQQLGRKVRGQFPVAFDSLGSEFLLRVLAEELAKEHPERGRKCRCNRPGARLRQLELLEFLGPALRLGVDCVLFAGEADLCEQSALLASGTGPAEQGERQAKPS